MDLEIIWSADIEQGETLEEIYSLHNKVCEKKEWYMHSKASRLQVLENLQKWFTTLKEIVNKNVRHMTKNDKIFLLTANNILTENRETSYSCASCRSRMCRRIKDKYNI